MLKQFVVAALVAGLGTSTSAATIFSATGATINSGGPGFGSIIDTFNQAGLISGYVSGVTDFDAYIASNPLHSFSSGEWFSDFGGAASVTYDLGVARTVESVALWNEDELGITGFNLLYSTDGIVFLPLLLGQLPMNNPVGVNYGPQVFGFGPTSLRYVRIDMFACPQPGGTAPVCGIGEVAFEAQGGGNGNGNGNGNVPEPGSTALLGLGIAGIAFARRRALRQSPPAAGLNEEECRGSSSGSAFTFLHSAAVAAACSHFPAFVSLFFRPGNGKPRSYATRA